MKEINKSLNRVGFSASVLLIGLLLNISLVYSSQDSQAKEEPLTPCTQEIYDANKDYKQDNLRLVKAAALPKGSWLEKCAIVSTKLTEQATRADSDVSEDDEETVTFQLCCRENDGAYNALQLDLPVSFNSNFECAKTLVNPEDSGEPITSLAEDKGGVPGFKCMCKNCDKTLPTPENINLEIPIIETPKIGDGLLVEQEQTESSE